MACYFDDWAVVLIFIIYASSFKLFISQTFIFSRVFFDNFYGYFGIFTWLLGFIWVAQLVELGCWYSLYTLICVTSCLFGNWHGFHLALTLVLEYFMGLLKFVWIALIIELICWYTGMNTTMTEMVIIHTMFAGVTDLYCWRFHDGTTFESLCWPVSRFFIWWVGGTKGVAHPWVWSHLGVGWLPCMGSSWVIKKNEKKILLEIPWCRKSIWNIKPCFKDHY